MARSMHPPRDRRRRASFFRSDGGNVVLIFALVTPLVVGAAGIGVETTYWSYKALHMQDAADAAAHAGALEQRGGGSASQVAAIAGSTAGQNGFDLVSGTIEVNTPPESGPMKGQEAVEVILHSPAHRFLTALFLDKDIILKARTVASFSPASNACVLALDPTASKAALFAGSTTVKLTGCSVMANSLAADAVTTQGSAQVTADCLISAGGVQTNGGVTLTKCAAPVTHAPPVADPFRNLVQPTPSGGCLNGAGGMLQPGRYCSGLNLSGNVTLASGVYILSDDFKINGNANVSGAGVTIYLTNGAHVHFNGNSTIQLSAPTSGTYAGMLMMGDRANTAGRNVINGNASSKLTGALYFPRDQVDYVGNFSGKDGCTQVVANTVQWSGNTDVAADCTSLGMQAIPAGAIVRITE